MMHNFSFQDPLLLLLLALVPLAVWIRGRRSRAPGALRFPTLTTVRRATTPFVVHLVRVPTGLRLLALTLLILAAARPQTEDHDVLSGEGVDVMIALDMSTSMNAVDLPEAQLTAILEDGGQPLNRFDLATEILQEFTRGRVEDRVGLVVFGAEAFLKFPPTLDYTRIMALLEGLILDNGSRNRRTGGCTNNCTISGAGTVIGDALGRSFQRLKRSKARSRAIILITDGANEGGRIQPEDIIQHIADQPEGSEVRVFTFLVGNDAETYVPGVDTFGRQSWARASKKWPTNPALLQEIANRTGGRYYESYDAATFRRHFAELERTEFQTKTRTRHKDAFVPLVLIALALLGAEVALSTSVLRKFP
jgi:Ca-activated chloride channel family protein